MTFLLNVLWFICGGVLAWLGWMLSGVVLACTVIGLPWAFAAFRIAPFAAWPFGRTLVDARSVGEERIVGTGVANVLWIVFAGLWLSLGHIVAGATLCLTIIGIPFGIAHFKLAQVCWAPLGKRIVDT